MRRLMLLLAVGLFGGAIAVLPGLATATNPSVTAGPDLAYHPSSLTIAPGGSVDFSHAGIYAHDVDFTGPLPQSCTNSDSTPRIGPSTANPSATPSVSSSSWSGTCTFTQAGTYTFKCDLHNFMGTIYVGTSPPPTTGTTTTTTTTTTTPPPPTTTVTTPTGTTPSGGGQAAASALKSSAAQRGNSVKGSVTIAAAGSDFEADLVGGTSQVARSVLVGKTVKHGVGAGKLNFRVSLNKRGRTALARHRKLALKLVVKVSGPGGASTTLSRSVKLRS